MSDEPKSNTVKWIAISTAILGFVAAASVLVVRYYEIEKAKAEAEQARWNSEKANPTPDRSKTSEPQVVAPAPSTGNVAGNESLLHGKWVRTDNEKVIVEFLPSGKMIPNENTSLSYTFATDDKGTTTIAVSDGDSGEVISVSKEELRIYWHIKHRILPDERHTVAYQRLEVYEARQARNQWLLGGIVAAVVIVGIIVSQVKKA
jgi:hypothetical protein